MTVSENFLFSEFDPVSAKQWKQKIQFDLKGADYNDALVWESLEGIKVKPFYHQEDLMNINSYQIPKDHNWVVTQAIYAGQIEKANQKAKDALNRGAESLIFTLPDKKTDWKALFSEIALDITPIHLDFHYLDAEEVNVIIRTVKKDISKIHLNLDIIGHLAKTGNWYDNLQKDHQILEQIVANCKNQHATTTLAVDMSLYQNAGANTIQQLAYGLTHANEYLNHFGSEVAINFKVGIGSNYFFEIAKVRALRWLFDSLTKEYGIEGDCHILAVPSKRNKTIYDYNVNMLRSTAECMSAILGGADSVCNMPYDTLYHKDNEFGERIARNQLLVLKEESHFDTIAHATNGTYYIEALTVQLAESALELFKQIESGGGFLAQLKNGIVQKKIQESAAKEQALFDTGKIVSVGTNKYGNDDDKMKDDLELYPFVKTDKRKTLIPPIIEKRLAEALEQERLKNE